VVDLLPDLAKTAQMEEAAAGDMSDVFTECQLTGIYEHAQVMYDI